MPYTGILLSPGYVSGNIFELTQIGKTISDKSYLSVFETLEKFEICKKKGLKRLKDLVQKIEYENERKILEAYQLILEDSALEQKIKEFIHLGNSLEESIQSGFRYFQEMMISLDDEYFSLRGEELTIVASYLLEEEGEVFSNLDNQDYILVANDLSPKEIFELPMDKIKGIILREGHPFTHTAILLKGRGIPVIYQCDIPSGVDGMRAVIEQEKVFVMNKSYPDFIEEGDRDLSWLEQIKSQVLVTGSIHFPEDIDRLHQKGIRDIGLYRSEWLYLIGEEVPSLKSQLMVYLSMANRVKEGFLRIRTLDLGEDKIPTYVKDKEIFKGLRGSGLYSAYPEMIMPQLEALVEVSLIKPMRVLMPMVEKSEEVLEMMMRLNQIKEAKNISQSQLSLGIMIESLEGYHHRRKLIALADECMIGTSDFYSDCLNKPRKALDDADFRSKKVGEYIKEIIREAKAQGKHIGLCGGLLDTKEGVLRGIDLGAREVCLSPHLMGHSSRKES